MNKSFLILLNLLFCSYNGFSSNSECENLIVSYKKLTDRKMDELYEYQSLYSKIVPYNADLPSQLIVKIATYLSLFDVNKLKQVSKTFKKVIDNHHRKLNRQYLESHYFDNQNNQAIQKNFKLYLTTCVEVYQSSHLFLYPPFKSWITDFLDVRLGALLASHCDTEKQLRLYFDYIDFIKDKKLLSIYKIDKILKDYPDTFNYHLTKGEELRRLASVDKISDQLKYPLRYKKLKVFIDEEKMFYRTIIDRAVTIIDTQTQDAIFVNPYRKFQLLCYRGKVQNALDYMLGVNNHFNEDPEILYLKFKQGLSQEEKMITKSGNSLLQLANICFPKWKQNVLLRTFCVANKIRQAYIDTYIKNSQHKIAQAQYHLGQLHNQSHYKDFYTPHNSIKAIEWYIKAASNNHAQAQFTLYTIYLKRDKVLLSNKKTNLVNIEQFYLKLLEDNAILWLKAAADYGIAAAQYHYGMQTFNAQDYNMAKKWFKLAADQNYTKAFYKLGQIYEVNDNAPLHLNLLALSWYDRAAIHNHKDAQFKMRLAYNYNLAKQLDQEVSKVSSAQYELGILYSHGDKLLEKNQMLAYFYLCLSSNSGNAMALYKLGTLYEKGNYVDEDTHQASSLYKKSAELGFSGALCKIAKIYQQSHNQKKALEFYKKIEHHHDYHSQYYYGKASYELSKIYNTNKKEKDDNFGAEFYLYKAAVFGYPKAQYNFLLNHFNRNEQNEYTKYEGSIFRKLYTAAVNRHIKAQFYLGHVYAQGIGVQQNFRRAAKWYFKSSQQDYTKAMSHLNALYEEGLIVEPISNTFK